MNTRFDRVFEYAPCACIKIRWIWQVTANYLAYLGNLLTLVSIHDFFFLLFSLYLFSLLYISWMHITMAIYRLHAHFRSFDRLASMTDRSHSDTCLFIYPLFASYHVNNHLNCLFFWAFECFYVSNVNCCHSGQFSKTPFQIANANEFRKRHSFIYFLRIG